MSRTRQRALPKAKGRCCLRSLPGVLPPAMQGLQAGQGSGHCPPRTPPRGEGVYVFGNIFCLARPALYRAGLFIAGAHAKHLVRQRAGVRRRAVLGRGRARNPLPCLARGLQRALPSDVEGCGGISEAPTFLVLLSHKSTNRPSMRRRLNQCRGLHLLLPCVPKFYSRPSFIPLFQSP